MRKKNLISMMLRRYNCSEIKEVKKLDLIFAGSLSSGDIKIVFDIEIDIKNNKRILLIQE